MRATIKLLRKELKKKEKQGYELDHVNINWPAIELPIGMFGIKELGPGPEIEINIVLRKV